MSEVLGPIAAILLALLALGYFAQSRLPPPKPIMVGIDLGTTFSCVGIYNAVSGNVSVLEDNLGNKLVPSAVYFGESKRLVGYPALHYQDLFPDLVIYDAKRFIGKRNIKKIAIKEKQKLYPFRLKIDDQGKITFGVGLGNNVNYYQPEDVGAFILSQLKKTAEKIINRKIEMAVISVPAEFDALQRNATIEAGRRAGLKVMRIINEPTAAALAYGLHKKNDISTVMVIDFGGGTLDVSLLNIQGGMFYTMAMAGNNRLGGQDISQNIFAYIVLEIKEKYGLDITEPSHLQQVRTEAEIVKVNLSSSVSVNVNITFKSLSKDATDLNFFHIITRDIFENINKDLFRKVLIPIERVLKEVEMNENEIDEIVLVGGSTRIPKVREIIHNYFGKKPNVAVDPELAVVTGVAIQAGILGGMWPLKVAAVELQANNLQKIEIGDEL